MELQIHGLFDDDVAMVHQGVSNYMELITKTERKQNETND